MSRVKFILMLSAAAVAASASAEAAPLISFSLNLPAPTVAVNQALSPSAIAGRLGQQGFRVQEMYRKGPAYAVTATGRSGNKVLLMVDGHSGVIIGMSVLAAAVPIAPQVAPNAVFVDDRHPFGAVVPEVIYDHWDRYTEPQWVQAGPVAITVKPTYAPFRYAVPFKFVHTSPRSHKSYALAPPNYRGMQLRNSSGQQIRAADTRADAADEEAAYQAERADQATYDKEEALGQRDEADQRADDLDRENNDLADYGAEQEQRANDAEARADAAEKQLEEQGHADDPCGSGCDIAEPVGKDTITPQEETPEPPAAPEQGETPAAPEQGGGGEPAVAPEQPAAPDQPAPQEEQPAPQQEQAAPEPEPQQEQAAPEPEPQQEQAAPEESGGGDQGGGGDSGGGGDDGGGDQ